MFFVSVMGGRAIVACTGRTAGAGAFTSALMRILMDVLGVGQVENCIKTVERRLQATISEHQRDCDKHLLRVEALVNVVGRVVG